MNGPMCCYTPNRQPRICNMPWASPGERTAHPALKRVLASGKRFNVSCFSEAGSDWVHRENEFGICFKNVGQILLDFWINKNTKKMSEMSQRVKKGC